MNSLRHFPLGTRFPDSPHAVISSLPTMADVRGYEEHDPRVLDALKSGYPRFVVHAFVQKLMEFYLQREGLVGRDVVLVDGRRAADDLLGELGGQLAKLEVDDGVYLVSCDATDAYLAKRLRKYVQHIGCGIYSRQAEDLLIKHGLLAGAYQEAHVAGDVLADVEQVLAEQIGCQADDVLLASCGMNAFYAGFRAVQEFQRTRGRTAWMQLGWLYLDSGCVLQEFLGGGETLDYSYDVFDVDAIVAKLRSYGDSLAAVVVECPSNPLIRVCEVHRIAEAVREQGGVMVIDPTIASVLNVDVLPCADLLVTSLTKYASIEGDIMIGALAVNPDSPYYGDLISRTARYHVPPYVRDLQRLASELKDAPSVVAQMSANASRLCAFLKKHPAVKNIYCAGCSDHIEEVAKGDAPVGSVISIELHGDMEKFYDTIRVMKGPSFGARFTLLCPFMYLAHYNLVTTTQGREFLASVGLDPELIRISVGAEDYLEIEAVFVEALTVCLL
ncbi:MAG: cystathionine gamma-synthase [Lentimonas sp.]|jgi:cystathionine gamma-synthase